MISDEPNEPDTTTTGSSYSYEISGEESQSEEGFSEEGSGEEDSSKEGSGEEEKGNNGIDCNDWCVPHKSKPNDYIRCDPIKRMIQMKQKGQTIKIPNSRAARIFSLVKECEQCKFCNFSDVCKKCPEKEKEIPEDSSEKGSGGDEKSNEENDCNNWCTRDNEWEVIYYKTCTNNPGPEVLKKCKKCAYCNHSEACPYCPIVDPPEEEIPDDSSEKGSGGDEISNEETNCNNWCTKDNEWEVMYHKTCTNNPESEVLKKCKKCAYCNHSEACLDCPIVDPPDAIG